MGISPIEQRRKHKQALLDAVIGAGKIGADRKQLLAEYSLTTGIRTTTLEIMLEELVATGKIENRGSFIRMTREFIDERSRNIEAFKNGKPA